MPEKSNFLINLSVLHRNTQKFFDHALAQYDIGSGQLLFLLYINENEGATMQEVTRISEVDKGTTTKGIQRLIDQGYVESRTDEKDRRVKRLYTTEKAAGIMNAIYEYRNRCRTMLAKGMDFAEFENMLAKASDNSRAEFDAGQEFSGVKIGGLLRMTLMDYPGKVVSTVFTAGCNFKCPYCHNKDLVFIPENYEYFDPQEVLDFLAKRKDILDAVCISGGEPLIQEDLILFLRKIRNMGYRIKLDTNGYYPDRLRKIIRSGLADYISMDIKNCREKYALTAGMNEDAFSIAPIEESVQILLRSKTEYEFRTTVVREFHTAEDIAAIGQWIKGADRYVLQQFEDSGQMIQTGLTAVSPEEMEEMRNAAAPYVRETEIRGIKGI